VARYEKTWQFDINRARSETTVLGMVQYTLWYYKAFLTGQIGGATKGLWSVAGSSDSLTAGMDGVDRWGSSFDATKIVRGSGTSIKSWVVLGSPPIKGVVLYLLLSYDSSIVYGITAYLTASLPTGGSVTVNPTVTSAATHSAAYLAIAPSSNSGDFHLHSGLSNDGSFFVLQSRDNTGLFVTGLLGSWLGNAKSSDNYPFWISSNCDTRVTNGFGSSSYGLNAPTKSFMLPPDGSVQTVWSWSGVLPATTNLPSGSDPFDSSYVDMPIFVGASATTIRGVRGRLQDIAFFPGGAPTGTTDATAGAPTYMVAGNYWFPTNSSPTL